MGKIFYTKFIGLTKLKSLQNKSVFIAFLFGLLHSWNAYMSLHYVAYTTL